MADLIERLLNAEPGARQEAAAEIRRLTASLAAMERERDAWREAVKNEPELPGEMPDEMWLAINGDREATQKALQLSVSLTKQNIALAARASTDALMKQSPESATKEPPNA